MNESETKLEGSSFPCSKEVLQSAVDYRGDVTLQLLNDREIVGYVFAAKFSDTGVSGTVSVYPKDSPSPEVVEITAIRSVVFSGADAAAGKSWEQWLKKVAEAKANGTIAELYPEEA